MSLSHEVSSQLLCQVTLSDLPFTTTLLNPLVTDPAGLHFTFPKSSIWLLIILFSLEDFLGRWLLYHHHFLNSHVSGLFLVFCWIFFSSLTSEC